MHILKSLVERFFPRPACRHVPAPEIESIGGRTLLRCALCGEPVVTDQ